MLYLLGGIATALTFAMFHTKNRMLGFPCVIFWAIFGAYCYTLSTTDWTDIYFYLFFASAFGMTIFCAIGMYALREKQDSIADDEMDEDSKEPEPKYIDETPADDPFSMENYKKPSASTRKLRERAEKRRTGEF